MNNVTVVYDNLVCSIIGQGCFLYLCFSAPVAGAYKNKVGLNNTDQPAGSEYRNLQSERYLL